MSDTRSRTLDLLTTLVALLVEPAERLPLSSDTDSRNLQLTESLARNFGILAQLPGDDDVATVTYSVGTDSRDYSTIAAWEADLDNGALYSSGDVARGELYNDSVFDESVTINGGGTVGLASVTLTSPTGERHDGTAGTGARIIRSVNSTAGILTLAPNGRPITVEFVEVGTSAASNSTQGVFCNAGDTGSARTVANCVVHGMFNDAGGAQVVGIACEANSRAYRAINNIVYDIDASHPSASAAKGIVAGAGLFQTYYHNNTVHSVTSSTLATCTGITFNDDADVDLRNNIVTSVTSTLGSAACYQLSSVTNAVVSHNLSSDTTASGTGSLTSKTAANQFVSIVGGSEDLHLKTGADAIDAGTDLGTTPTGVNIDIDGRDRDLEGDTWDMGADEFVSAAAANMAFSPVLFAPFSGQLLT